MARRDPGRRRQADCAADGGAGPAVLPLSAALRAPRADRSLLAVPALSEVGALVAENLARRDQADCQLQGRSLADLSRTARADMLREAYRWTCAYRDVKTPRPEGSERVLLAGHQPQLFHPGVWFKNFALGWLAARHQALAVNLIIDSDTVKGTSITVPSGAPDDPRQVSVAMDQSGPAIPFEERRILDRARFAGFGRAVAEPLRDLIRYPLVGRYWPLAVSRSCYNDNLGACLARARHQLEGRWGLETLEVPQSRICQSDAFFWLVAHLVAELPRFQQVYNAAVRQYRARNRIRNAAHPVPELIQEGEWLEAPFWVWSTADPRRRPLFAARRGDHWVLSDRHGWEEPLPVDRDREAGPAVERLRDLSARGIKIRSRALVTTLWARLALGDVFLHGIGGGKYDQVTDVLIERFFGLRPPQFVILSATLYLPVPRPDYQPQRAGQLARRLRELTWHPERFLPPQVVADPAVRRLVGEKCRWIEDPRAVDRGRARWLAFRRINEALQPWVEPSRQGLLQERDALAHAERLDRVLSWREYAFCLYPEGLLREFFFSVLRDRADDPSPLPPGEG